MATTQEQKHNSAGGDNPLFLSGVLQIVLSCVGLGHCLFVGPVSKWWKEMYFEVKSQQLTVDAGGSRERDLICVPQMTLYSSVFASPSRVKLDCTSESYQRAVGKYADIATVVAAHELGMQYTQATMAAVAQRNKLAEVQYLHSEGCPWAPLLLRQALSSRYFELARWCYEHGCSWGSARAAYFPAESGNVELMAWVLQQPGTELDADVMMAASSKGDLLMCQYLHTRRCPWDTSSMNEAAHDGHVDLLHWLVDSGCPWDAQDLCWHAAHGSSVEVLKYLQQQGLLTSMVVLRDLLMAAAIYSKDDAAQWLREQGAEFP
jgi:hypothetical protein